MHIKRALSAMDGIESVEGNPDTKGIVVEVTAPASDEMIRDTLVSIGYPAGK